MKSKRSFENKCLAQGRRKMSSYSWWQETETEKSEWKRHIEDMLPTGASADDDDDEALKNK